MAPARAQITPTSRRSRLRLFFATNPGWHQLAAVASSLGDEYLKVANEAARMARTGDLDRHYTDVPGKKRPDVLYAVPGTNPPTDPTED